MATTSDNTCDVCMHNFDEADRKSLALPCGHDFCLTCLTCLKTSGSQKCPKCRNDWAELEVEALLGIENEEGAGACQVKEEELDGKVKNDVDLCLNHLFSFQYWCVDENEFHCKKCIVEKRCSKLELIEEAIPLIKTDLRQRVTEKLQIFQTDLKELQQIKNEVIAKLNLTKQYKEAVQRDEDDLQGCLTKLELRIVDRRKSSSLVGKLLGRIEEVKSEFDVPLVVKSRKTLEALSKPTDVPNAVNSQALLCNTAFTYMGATGLEGPPAEAAFIHGLLKASGSSVELLTEVVRAAEELKGGGEWTVDSSNCLAARLALADRQPRLLTLLARSYKHEALPVGAVEAVAKAARGCEVELRFQDSFYAPQDSKRDLERLNHLMNNSSLCLILFYGHLDAAGIAKLPHTISTLGLAIGSTADARAVSDLRPWKGLVFLAVSVSCGVAAQDLKPLPRILVTDLHFPGLTDARVDSVRPAIEALMGPSRLNYLTLTSSQLTAGGARHLVRLLVGIGICGLRIEASGPWRPGGEEKGSLEAELKGSLGCTWVSISENDAI